MVRYLFINLLGNVAVFPAGVRQAMTTRRHDSNAASAIKRTNHLTTPSLVEPTPVTLQSLVHVLLFGIASAPTSKAAMWGCLLPGKLEGLGLSDPVSSALFTFRGYI